MKRNIEILAPAGSYDGMRAAMNAGCDAVYIGGMNFGARAYADNPDEDTLLHAIDEAHLRDKKLYLTVNTLLREKELTGSLYRFLERYYLQGLDAVIVQDVGVMRFIHRNFPELPIHASTQMTLTMAQGANLLKSYGVTRIVTARELSLGEIETIRRNTDLEIETFVHGALCYCYSGQCLMSSMIGGRSGNRGRCAQPCRMPYQFYSGNKRLSSDQEKYLLSPKDINTLAIIPELIDAGIDSFKIEGRMKRPEYAAAVASKYRKYVDLYLELGRDGYMNYLKGNEFYEGMLELLDIYNRGGFSEGYGRTYHGKKMMSLYRPNHGGVYVGEVKEAGGSQAAIFLKEKLNAQDVLEIRHNEEEGYEFTVKDPHNPGEILRTNVGRRPEPVTQEEKASGNRTGRFVPPVIRAGDPVYRTRNNALLDYLTKEYLDKDRKLGIQGFLKARAGEKLSLTVIDRGCEVTAYQDKVAEAYKQPMTRDKLAAPLLKTGDTLYFFEDLHIDADDNIFVPVAWLNEVRREAISLLMEKIIAKHQREFHADGKPASERIITGSDAVMVINSNRLEGFPEANDKKNTRTLDQLAEKGESKTCGISVVIQTTQQFDIALTFPEITTVYADYDTFSTAEILRMAQATEHAEKVFCLSLPHICRFKVYERLKKDIYEIIGKDNINGFLVKNFEEIELLQPLFTKEKQKRDIILNYNMYTYNREAKTFWTEQGVTRFTAPVELNFQELKDLGIQDCDMVVYGYLPLMVSSQCLFENTQGCRVSSAKGSNKPDRQSYSGTMTDRLGKKFYVKTNCTECINTIYNGQALALYKQAEEITGLKPMGIRMDFTKESPEEAERILSVFIGRYRYGRTDTGELTDYTTGHFKRGVE